MEEKPKKDEFKFENTKARPSLIACAFRQGM